MTVTDKENAMRRLLPLLFVIISTFSFGQGWGGVAQGIADAQQRDLQRKHELQMQREAEQYALELARIQAQSNAPQTTASQNVPSSAPYWESGNAFLAACATGFEKADQPGTQTDVETMGLLACIGFLHGVTDGVTLGIGFASATPTEPWVCMPPTATAIQAGRVVVKYIRAHPETAHEPPSVLALLAFREAFPCPPVSAK